MVEEKKNVLITGGSGHLGSCFINKYKDVYKFFSISRGPAPVGEGNVIPIECDLCNEGAPDQLYREFGGLPRITYVINAAADVSFHAERSEILCASKAVLQQVNLNCIAPAIVIAALFEAQLKDRPMAREAVSILNISSESAFTVFPGRQAFYASSKAALNCLTLHLAREYRNFNVKINALAPGNLANDERCTEAAETICKILQLSDTGRIYRMT